MTVVTDVDRKRRRNKLSLGVKLEEFLSLEESHPYGVLPGGNRFFLSSADAVASSSSASSSPPLALAGTKERQWFRGGSRIGSGSDSGSGSDTNGTTTTTATATAGQDEDELWQMILSFCDATTLSNVTTSSRYFYVTGHQPELWRDLVLRRCDQDKCDIDITIIENKDERKIRSWKDLYHVMFCRHENSMTSSSTPFSTHLPLPIPGMYSDEFYRTHRCRSFAIPDAWLDRKNTDVEDTVPSIDIQDMTAEHFFQQFECPNRPVVIRGAAGNTPAVHKWKLPNYLVSQQQQHQHQHQLQPSNNGNQNRNINNDLTLSYRTTSGAAPLPVNFSLPAYQSIYSQFQYLEESPLYLFDRTAFSQNPNWANDFFPQFYQNCPWWDPSLTSSSTSSNQNYGHDLFQYLGSQERPDHTWLIMGPKRSGSVFHIDPNATHAWNACIQGRKRWIFYPPGCPPPGVFPSDDGDEVAVPLSVGEWLLQHWNEHLQRCKKSASASAPLECTVYPGDVLFVPHGYWHMVINLDDVNCAITHNYVSPSNLGNALKFLQEKTDQISGCRDRQESIKPNDLYTQFVNVLSQREPKFLQTAQAQNGWTCPAWTSSIPQQQKQQEHHPFNNKDTDKEKDKEDVNDENNNDLPDHTTKKRKHDADNTHDKKHLHSSANSSSSLMAKTEKVANFSFSFL